MKHKKLILGILGCAALLLIFFCVKKAMSYPKDITYAGNTYTYNKDLTTILFLGVDSKGDLQPKNAKPTEFGQSDAIYLVLIDKSNSEVRMINIVRDSIVPLHVYDSTGKYISDQSGQLCLQYAYGDGGEESCRLVADQVSTILYNMPIDYYVAANKASFEDITDFIGGITVTMSDDYTTEKHTYKKGETVTLSGDDAMDFLYTRDTTAFSSNLNRVGRQKDYLNAMFTQLLPTIKKDPTMIPSLYNAVSDHMYTNISLKKMIRLAGTVLNDDFSFDDFQVLPGEYVSSEKFDEYYIDKEGIYKLVVNNFYTIKQ